DIHSVVPLCFDPRLPRCRRRSQMRRLLVAWIVGTFLVVAVAPIGAQQGTSELGGRAVDDQGAVLPGVTIIITNVETGRTRELTSGGDCSFFASQLVPGRYKIEGKLQSFRNFERAGLVLAIGQRMTVNVTMSLGALEETVTVSGTSPLVDTTSIKVGGTVGTAELSELPAMNRNYFSTVALLPGVQFSPSNQMGND